MQVLEICSGKNFGYSSFLCDFEFECWSVFNEITGNFECQKFWIFEVSSYHDVLMWEYI